MNKKSKMVVGALCFVSSSLWLSAAASFADDDDVVVRWRSIVGVISAPRVNNPVGDIDSGTFPWSARSGRTRVNLSTGAFSFRVDGAQGTGPADSLGSGTACVEGFEGSEWTVPVPTETSSPS